MQSAAFTFQVDVEKSLMRITMSGFFGEQDIDRFIAARAAALRLLRCEANQHVTLVDIRDMQIQSQDRVGDFQQVLSDPRVAARRLAFVVARSLSRLQVQRAAEGRDARYFGSVREAEEWLLGPEDASVADPASSGQGD